MPELENVEQPKVAGYMQRKHINKNQKRIEEDEKDLAELMSKNKDKAEVKE